MFEKILNSKYFPWGAGFVGGVIATKVYDAVTSDDDDCRCLPEGKGKKKKKNKKNKHEED